MQGCLDWVASPGFILKMLRASKQYSSLKFVLLMVRAPIGFLPFTKVEARSYKHFTPK